MPKKKITLGMGGRARALVKISHPEVAEAVTYTLPVNDGFADDFINRAGGVDYPRAPEVGEAERAIAQVFNEDIGSLRAWVSWAARTTGGGLAGLAAALLGMPLNATTRADKAYKAELRKLEEYRQGKYKSASGPRQQRIQDLNAKLLRRGAEINLKVLGDWTVTSGKGGMPRTRAFHWWKADDSAGNIDLLDAGGAGFCEQVRFHYERFTQSMVTLEHVYALQIERIKES